MEKFSKYRDPLTGINPFLPPIRAPITFFTCIRAFLKLPIYILYLCGFPVLPWLIRMLRQGSTPKGVVHANSVGKFDKPVIQHLFGISAFKRTASSTFVLFPEGAPTNNTGILAYKTPRVSDFVIGLRYSPECIFLSQVEHSFISSIMATIRFLGSSPRVTANCIPGHDLALAASLPALALTSKDMEGFVDLYRQKTVY